MKFSTGVLFAVTILVYLVPVRARKIISLSYTKMCLMHFKYLDDLRKFTQTDEFHVYTSLEEAEKACSDAKDAYLYVESFPECITNSTQKAILSSLINGSYRLLHDFCGFRAKRRPCCALRTAYLEYSDCYGQISNRLNDCNVKYRKSFDAIMTLQDEYERKIERFCSMKWFGSCVRKTTKSRCGEEAAQVIKMYVMKTGDSGKIAKTENKKCLETPFGI